MKLTSAERLHHTHVQPDGSRIIQTWNHRKSGKTGRPVHAKPGDGLRTFNREKTTPGDVLYTPDHSNKFLLINLQGEIVHEWPAWTSHFGYLLPNGHLLLDTEFSPGREVGVAELDWDGNEVWFCPCQIHHDFQRLPNGNTILLCQREVENKYICGVPLLSTYLYEVTPDNDVVWEWYSEEHIEELERLHGQEFPLEFDVGDWTHSNTVQVIPDTPASKDLHFKAGNVIVNHRNLNAVCVIERESGEIVWTWGKDIVDWPHATIMLPNGHLLCFDNGAHRDWSAVIEMNPLTGEIVWEYKGNPPSSFSAQFLSNAQRLENGNTFICSGAPTGVGRLFEVTPKGEIVWEFQNPYAEYADGESIVYRAYKYPSEMIEPLL